MEKLPEDWLFVTLNEIKDGQTRHAAEMRQGFQEIRKAQMDHELDDQKWKGEVVRVVDRVDDLVKRQDDASTFTRGLHTTFIASGLLAAWEGVKHFAGWK